MSKTATKTANVPALIPQPGGRGALYAGGVPGNKGGGRQSSAFLAALHDIPARARIPEVVEGIISGDIRELLGKNADGEPIVGETRNSDRIRAIEYVTDRVLGKVPQSVEVTTPQPLTFRLVRE